MLLQANMHDARQHQAEKVRGYPGLWSLGNLGALEAGPIASHRTASAVLVRDEAWKIAPKSIALEAGRLAGGGVSPLAHRHMHPHLISGWGHQGAQQVELAGLLGGMGMDPPGWVPLPWKPPWRYLVAAGKAERQNSTTSFTGKTGLARRKQPAEAKPRTAPL